MHSHHDAEIAEFEAKQKELETMFNPIMLRVYRAAGGQEGGQFPGGQFPGGQFPGGQPQGQRTQGESGTTTSGPTVDEVD